jgi:hypothetical protein
MAPRRTSKPEVPRIAYTLDEASQAVGVSKRILWTAIQDGDLTVRYPTSRPVIPADELAAWINSRPTSRETSRAPKTVGGAA